jgi:hypothetical protein
MLWLIYFKIQKEAFTGKIHALGEILCPFQLLVSKFVQLNNSGP